MREKERDEEYDAADDGGGPGGARGPGNSFLLFFPSRGSEVMVRLNSSETDSPKVT